MYRLAQIIAELVSASHSARWDTLATLILVTIEAWKKHEPQPTLLLLEPSKEEVREHLGRTADD